MNGDDNGVEKSKKILMELSIPESLDQEAVIGQVKDYILEMWDGEIVVEIVA